MSAAAPQTLPPPKRGPGRPRKYLKGRGLDNRVVVLALAAEGRPPPPPSAATPPPPASAALPGSGADQVLGGNKLPPPGLPSFTTMPTPPPPAASAATPPPPAAALPGSGAVAPDQAPDKLAPPRFAAMLAGFLHRWNAILADQERKPSPKPEPEDLLQASDSQRLVLPARAREPEPEPPSHRERVLDRADDSPAAASGTPSSPSSSCRSKAVKLNVHLNFEDGWRVLEQGIVTCSKILEGSTGTRPTVAEYTNCYDCAYRMAMQTTSYCEEMYSGFKATLAESVRVLVLPHLMHKRDDDLLRQLLKMWSNYCTMVKCISGFFSCLDRCFVEQRKLPCLEDAAATSFFATVFSFNHEIADALLTLIRQERDGRKVDMDLLMAIMRGICRSEVKPSMKYAVLQDTYAYYSRKGSEWIVQYPLQDYLAKVQDTVEKETMRLMHYLCIPEGDCSELCLKVVSAPLMQTYDSYAKEKQIGGQLLLQTYKTVEDDLLARCNRLTIGSSSDNSSASYME